MCVRVRVCVCVHVCVDNQNPSITTTLGPDGIIIRHQIFLGRSIHYKWGLRFTIVGVKVHYSGVVILMFTIVGVCYTEVHCQV